MLPPNDWWLLNCASDAAQRLMALALRFRRHAAQRRMPLALHPHRHAAQRLMPLCVAAPQVPENTFMSGEAHMNGKCSH